MEANDNDPLTFTKLAAATARVVLKLDEKNNEQRDAHGDSGAGDEQPGHQQCEAVDDELRRLLAM